jgi:hypothetical protein
VAATGFGSFWLGTGGLILVAGMLSHPLHLGGRRERRPFWLDAATVMVAGVIIAWYVAGPPPGSTPDGDTPARTLAGPGIFVVLLFGIVKLGTAGTAGSHLPGPGSACWCSADGNPAPAGHPADPPWPRGRRDPGGRQRDRR